MKGNSYANILRENRKRYNTISFGCTLESPGKLKEEQCQLHFRSIQLDSLGLSLGISVCLKALQV